MNLKEVKYVYCISKTKSITKAAAELYISQPSLSKFLINLENQIGSKLFSRIGHELVPTYFGERYINYAKQIMVLCNEWETECSDIMKLQKGKLSIAFPLMRSLCIIPATLPLFYQIYPNIQVTLYEEAYSVEERIIQSDEIDIAIFNPITVPSSLDYQIIGTEELVIVLNKNHPLVEKGQNRDDCRYPWIDLKLFANETFILNFPEQNTGRLSLELFKASNINPPILLQTRNTELSLQLTAMGMGVSFVPESYYKKVHFSMPITCFSIGYPKTEITLIAAYKKGHYLPKYACEYIQLTKDYMMKQI